MTIPTIKTSRLILRAFTAEDVDPFVHVLAEKDVLRYFPNSQPPSRSKVEKMVVEQLMHWQKYGYGWWAVEPRAEGKFIGWCGLQYLRETEEIEVAYLLSRAYWGQGFATEAAQASLAYGFETLGLQSIVGIVHREHKASQRVLEKLGMNLIEQAQYFGMDCFRYVIERVSGNPQVSPTPRFASIPPEGGNTLLRAVRSRSLCFISVLLTIHAKRASPPPVASLL